MNYRHFFVRDQVNDGKMSLTHVSSENQLADIFNKYFYGQRLIFLGNHLVVSRANTSFCYTYKCLRVQCVVQCTNGGKSLLEYMSLTQPVYILLRSQVYLHVRSFYTVIGFTDQRYQRLDVGDSAGLKGSILDLRVTCGFKMMERVRDISTM